MTAVHQPGRATCTSSSEAMKTPSRRRIDGKSDVNERKCGQPLESLGGWEDGKVHVFGGTRERKGGTSAFFLE